MTETGTDEVVLWSFTFIVEVPTDLPVTVMTFADNDAEVTSGLEFSIRTVPLALLMLMVALWFTATDSDAGDAVREAASAIAAISIDDASANPFKLF